MPSPASPRSTSLAERYPVATEDLPKVATRLRERGFSAEDIAKVMGGDFLRVWEAVWGT